jgi:hypothetical protein
MGENARQMLPTVSGEKTENHWLTILANSESPAVRAKVRSIHSRHDNIVSPQQSAQLPGAENVAFDLIGHVALGFDSEVLRVLMTEITTARQSRCSKGTR